MDIYRGNTMDYEKHYSALIERARNRIIDGYVEKHHIIPKCMGGSDDESNLVILTPEEHFVAHQLLVKMYPDNYKLILALAFMTSSTPQLKKRNNKKYGWTRRKNNIALKNIKRKKPRPYKRKTKRVLTETHKNRIANSLSGRNHSEETKRKIRDSNLGLKHNYIENECPHCGKVGKGPNMSRYHFDRCKILIR
jgi:hypothetical protein